MLLPLVLALLPAAQSYDAYRRNPRLSPEVLVVREARPAVVCVEAIEPPSRPFRGLTHLGAGRPAPSGTRGSGVVVFEDGYIVTNWHVVARAAEIRVIFEGDAEPRVLAADLVSQVPEEDLALLKVEVDEPLEVVRLGTSSDLEIGERVLAIGNSFGQGITVTAGIVSALHRNFRTQNHLFRDLIQTDASINPGSSGGPLLNMNGELIGINTGVNLGAENMGYAIPVDTVQQVLQDQLLGDSAARTWLGFDVGETAAATSPAEPAAVVTAVVPGGPAALAGLRPGDLIVSLDGRELQSAEDFRRLRLPLLPEQSVRLVCRRDGEPRSFELTGWNKVDGILFDRLGLTLESLAVGRVPYVRIQRLRDGGPASELGLRPGDLIDAVRIGGQAQAWRIHGAADLAQLVSDLEPGTELAVDVLRDDDGNGRLDWRELYKGTLTVD